MESMAIPWHLIAKVLLAGMLGGLVGVERDLSGRPAGLRTNLVIAIASCLFTLISIEAFRTIAGADPTRIAAQIVTGVGFLGAGVLLHQKDRVLGLTTAADVWLVAAIGMGVAVGMYALSIAVTFIAVICVWALAPVSHWLEARGKIVSARLMAKNTEKPKKKR